MSDMPSGYSTPMLSPTIPGADWYIEGRRYREVDRQPVDNGHVITLERRDIAPLYTVEES